MAGIGWRLERMIQRDSLGATLGAFLTGGPVRGALYGLVAVLAFSLIYRNLRADPTLEANVDSSDSASLGLMPDRTGS